MILYPRYEKKNYNLLLYTYVYRNIKCVTICDLCVNAIKIDTILLTFTNTKYIIVAIYIFSVKRFSLVDMFPH